MSDRHSHSGSALIILDMLSDYRYSGGMDLLPAAQRAARRIADLKRRLRTQRIPAIYVNDMHGHWESDQATFLRRCLEGPPQVASLIEKILPGPEDYFIFKPRHSAFFATPLQELLSSLAVNTLILTGLTSHQCVLFTAIDAHVRKINVTVARDCIAAASTAATRHALFILEHAVGAHVLESRYIRFRRRRGTAAGA